MKSNIILAAGMLAMLPAPAVTAQDAPAVTAQDNVPPKTVCQIDPGFRQFDFWLGDWKVTDNATGKYVGNNKITAIEGDCMVLEEWAGLEGSTGKSVNYYNPVSGKWRQLWLSAGAYAIDYEGGIKDGKMILEGTIWYYAAKKEFPFRGIWTPNEDGSVRQYFEQFDPKDNSWKVWADGTYVKS